MAKSDNLKRRFVVLKDGNTIGEAATLNAAIEMVAVQKWKPENLEITDRMASIGDDWRWICTFGKWTAAAKRPGVKQRRRRPKKIERSTHERYFDVKTWCVAHAEELQGIGLEKACKMIAEGTGHWLKTSLVRRYLRDWEIPFENNAAPADLADRVAGLEAEVVKLRAFLVSYANKFGLEPPVVHLN